MMKRMRTMRQVLGPALAIIPTLAFAALVFAGDAAKQEKLSVNKDLAFAVAAKVADPYAIQTDFRMSDALLKDLYTLQDVWRKRTNSKAAIAEGVSAADYVQGVYQGFMIGVAAEDFRKGKSKVGAPICEKDGVTMRTKVESAIRGLERIPEKERSGQMASHAIIIQFLEDGLYGECLNP